MTGAGAGPTGGGFPDGRLVPLPDADLHVHETGPATGRPVVLLHGFLTSAYTWRDVAPALARAHRVIMVDLPGSGRSPDPRASDWSADRCVGLMEALLDTLGLESPTLVGSQMGGSLVAWFAARHPSRVGRLVVMAAGALGEVGTNLTLYRLLAHPLIGSRLARRFPRRTFESRWQAAHGPGHSVDPVALNHYFAQLRTRGQMIAQVGLGIRRSYGESFNALAEPIRGLRIPTLLIFGEQDPLVPVSTGQRFAELLFDARLLVLPDCGDFPQEERPREVADAILEFVGSDRSDHSPLHRPASGPTCDV